MANKTSYSYQLTLLGNVIDQIDQLKKELTNVSVRYKTNMQNLHDQDGLMDEVYDEYYTNFIRPNIEAMEALVTRIDAEDNTFIQKEIDFLSSR